MKRINFKLLLGLGVTSLALVAGVFALHAAQVNRNAGSLKVQADEALSNQKLGDAAKYYEQYLEYRDDPVAHAALSKLLYDAAIAPTAEIQDVRKAYNRIEAALRKHPALNEVRRRQVDLCFRFDLAKDVITHVEQLRDHQGSDASCEAKYAACQARLGFEEQALASLKKLVGWQDGTQSFDTKQATGVHELDAYRWLALLMIRRNQKELAAEVVDQMVQANPQSANAYLLRGQFRQEQKETDGAAADFDKALELAPDNVDVILSWAQFRLTRREFEAAIRVLDEAIGKHPKQDRFYVLLSRTFQMQLKFSSALGALNNGLKNSPNSLDLLIEKADLLSLSGDVAELRKLLPSIGKNALTKELVGFFEASALVTEQKWNDARKALEEVRPYLASRPNLGRHLLRTDLSLGECYGKLGQPDRQIAAYQRVLDSNPKNEIAIRGLAAANAKLGKTDVAKKLLEGMATKDERTGLVLQLQQLQELVTGQRKLPPEERNWDEVDSLIADLQARRGAEVPEEKQVELEAQVLAAKEQYRPAKQALEAALEKHPQSLSLWSALVRVVQEEPTRPEAKTQALFELVERAEKAVGDVLYLRQVKATALAASASLGANKEAALAELKRLETGVEKFTAEEQLNFWAQMALTYYRVRDYDNLKRCWGVLREKRPDDSGLVKYLFDMAYEFGKLEDMRAEAEELKRLQGASSADYKFTQAAILFWQVKNRQVDRSQAERVRQLLKEAGEARPGWHEVPQLNGELAEFDRKPKEAVAHYVRALDLGPANPVLHHRLAMLHYRMGDMQEAQKYIAQIDPERRDKMLDVIASEKDVREGRVEDALESARLAVESDPENPENHMWLGRMLESAGQNDEAEAAYRAAVKTGPEKTSTWLTLVNHLIKARKRERLQPVLEEAEQKLPEAESAMVLAMAYEMSGDNAQAEEKYLALIKASPENLRAVRALVIFYSRLNRGAEAEPYLEQLVQAKLAADDPQMEHVYWARREKAVRLARGGGYQELKQALALLELNAAGGRLGPEELHVKAVLLAERPDKPSREQALAILRELATGQTLTPEEQLLYGQLLEGSDKWSQARDELQRLVTATDFHPRYALPFAHLLLKHQEFAGLETLLRQLDRKAPNSLGTLELKARLYHQQGKTEQLVAVVQKLLGDGSVSKEELPRMVNLATLLQAVNQNNAAEKLLRDYVAVEPRGALALAGFLGQHGDLSEALSYCEEARKSRPLDEVISIALGVLRARAGEASREHFAQVERWVESALEDEPERHALLFALAELRDLQGQSADTVKIYRQLLALKDLRPDQVASASNNLAYQIAVSQGGASQAAEALQLVERAMEYFGQASDLIDTRGMVHLAAGNLDQALADLQAAVGDGATGNKYFHLALAQFRAGRKTDAAASMKKAQAEKFTPVSLVPAERALYSELQQGLGLKK